MLVQLYKALIIGTIAFATSWGQAPARLLGTVAAVNGDTFSLKSESGETVTVETAPNVKVQKVAPGERDLSKAQTISLTDIASGDRILVRGSKITNNFRADSVIVMTARDIAQRDESTRKAWQERGAFGVVEEVNAAGGEIRVAGRAAGSAPAQSTVVIVSPNSKIRKYAPDSIKFADALPGTVGEIRKGDHLRAMGEKSADGTRLTAEQIVFGTFRTVAGTVSAVQPDRNQIALKDIQTGKMLQVFIKPDSQLKKMAFPEGGMGIRQGVGPRAGAGAGSEGFRGRMQGGRGPDLSAMLERMPSITLAELKPGDTVIVSSTVGGKTDELTAIALVTGAEPIIEMLRARSDPNNGQDPLAGGSSLDRGLDGILGMPTQ
jgi:hypothetical protein